MLPNIQIFWSSVHFRCQRILQGLCFDKPWPLRQDQKRYTVSWLHFPSTVRSAETNLFVISQILGDTKPDLTKVSRRVGEKSWDEVHSCHFLLVEWNNYFLLQSMGENNGNSWLTCTQLKFQVIEKHFLKACVIGKRCSGLQVFLIFVLRLKIEWSLDRCDSEWILWS